MRKKSLILIIWGILSIVFFSCSIKYVPIQTPDISISDDFAILKNKDVTFAVENKYWIKEPQNLTDYFTTFYVSIKNNSSETMEISQGDIVLLDENGNQFDVISQEYIESLLLPKQIEYLVIDHIEENERQPRNREEFLEEQRNTLEKWRDAKKNLITYSLHFGTLHPGAQKSGFIFFPKLESSNNECMILFRNHSIPFIRSDVKKQTEKETTQEL